MIWIESLLKLIVRPLLITQIGQSWKYPIIICVFQRPLSPHWRWAVRLFVNVRLQCVCKWRGNMWEAPPRWFLLITQRAQPTPGHFLPDLPQESRACWASAHTCWSQTILLPVPDGATDTGRTTERESHGFFQTLAAFTSFSLTLWVSLSFISLLTIHSGPADSALGTK